MVAMMKAVVFDRYGPLEVLRIADLPTPGLAPGQLLIEVLAAGAQQFRVSCSYPVRQSCRIPETAADPAAGEACYGAGGSAGGCHSA
jgi:hypothetical protein